MASFRDKVDAIFVEDILDKEGITYKLTHGSSGEQVNVETCPFCHGDEWKTFINRETGVGNCFHGSCGVTFHKTKLIGAIVESENFRDIARYVDALVEDVGFETTRQRASIEVSDAEDWELPDSMALPTPDGRTLQYLADRSFGPEVAERFHLRYCSSGWYVYKKADGEDGYMKFDDRVIIPVYDIDGNMVTFQGRDITGEADRKYLFPAGLPGTSAFLYNAHNVTKKTVIVMNEGVTDVWRTEQNLEKSDFDKWGVVGSFGIKFSTGRDGRDQQHALLRLKKMGLRIVVVMWDGEERAFDRALQACEVILGLGLKAEIAMTPKDKDPGELSRAEAISAIVNRMRVRNKIDIARLRLKNPYKTHGKSS